MIFLAFVLGFLTRAAIAYISALTYDWRQRRAWRRYALRRLGKEETIMRWRVKAIGIQWDVGNPDDYDPKTYHPERLPSEAEVIVSAEDEAEAIDQGLSDISDAYCFLIEGTNSIEVELLKRRRTD